MNQTVVRNLKKKEPNENSRGKRANLMLFTSVYALYSTIHCEDWKGTANPSIQNMQHLLTKNITKKSYQSENRKKNPIDKNEERTKNKIVTLKSGFRDMQTNFSIGNIFIYT